MPLKGTVTISENGMEDQSLLVDKSQSWLEFFTSPPPSAAHVRERRIRYFRYHLAFEDKGTFHRLEGVKIVRDDSRFDLWQDLATLYIELFDGSEPDRLVHRGVMHLNPLDFFQRQLRSITITPPDADPTRRSWAYAAFVRYYLEELTRIYVSRPDLIRELVQNVIDPVHDA